MKKVLLTGARGFIARHATSLLQDRNYLIHATTSRSDVVHPRSDSITWHQINLLDLAAVSELMRTIKPTHLMHFAWYTEHGKFWNAEENLMWTSATLHLIKEFKKNSGQRIVGVGSCAEYDWRYGFCNENITPLDPLSLYGRCKGAVCSIAQEYTALWDLSFAWGRIFFLYGPYENKKRLVAYVITSLLQNRTANCSHGKQTRDFMHVADVADAFVTLLDSRVEGPVNIASGNPLSLKKVIDIIGEKLNRHDLIRYGTIPSKHGDPPLLVGDVQRLENELHWRPQYGIVEGLERTINWWKDNL